MRYFSAFDCTEGAAPTDSVAVAKEETPLIERMARASGPTTAGGSAAVPWSASPLTNRSPFRFAHAADFAPPTRAQATSTAGGSGQPVPQVCLVFKDDLYEEWVAGLNASDGLHFFIGPCAGTASEHISGIIRSMFEMI